MCLKIASDLMIPKAKFFHWGTVNRQEVGFVIGHGRHLMAIEIKLMHTPSFYHIKNILTSIEEYPPAVRGFFAPFLLRIKVAAFQRYLLFHGSGSGANHNKKGLVL